MSEEVMSHTEFMSVLMRTGTGSEKGTSADGLMQRIDAMKAYDPRKCDLCIAEMKVNSIFIRLIELLDGIEKRPGG